MTQQSKTIRAKASRPQRIAWAVIILAFMFGGMILCVASVFTCRNYSDPYTFMFVSGAAGLVAGLMFSKLVKPYVISGKANPNYGIFRMCFCAGFIGGFILLAHAVNMGLSSQEYRLFAIVNMDHEVGRRGSGEYYIVYLNVDGKSEKLYCRLDYWKDLAIGETVPVCIYKSPIGFDKFVLMDEN